MASLYERQGSGGWLVFLESLNSTLNPFDSMPARIDASSVIIECISKRFPLRSIMTLTGTKSEFGACWIVDAHPRWLSSVNEGPNMNMEEIKEQ